MIDQFDLLKAEYLGKFEGAVKLCRRLGIERHSIPLSIYLSSIMVDFAKAAFDLGVEAGYKEGYEAPDTPYSEKGG